MSPFYSIICAFLASALLSAIVMPQLIRVCYKRGIFDLPDGRKVHKNAVPRLGGVVFVPATIAGLIAGMALKEGGNLYFTMPLQITSFCIGGAAVMVYFMGIIDDLLNCPARIKFGIQFLAASVFPLCALYIDSMYGFCGIWQLPLLIAYPLTVFVTLIVINAINLIDGIDGLSSALSMIALVVYAYLYYQMGFYTFVYICAAMVGTLFVFFVINVTGTVERKTKTFMGDSGSLLIGFVLAYFSIKYIKTEATPLPSRADGLLMAWTLQIVPCIDLCRVAVCRLCRGKGMFSPDKTHIHHKMMAAGLSMRQSLVAIVCLQIGYILLNTILFAHGVRLELIVLIDVLLYAILHWYLPIPTKP